MTSPRMLMMAIESKSGIGIISLMVRRGPSVISSAPLSTLTGKLSSSGETISSWAKPLQVSPLVRIAFIFLPSLSKRDRGSSSTLVVNR
jgi:hypothetical protein